MKFQSRVVLAVGVCVLASSCLGQPEGPSRRGGTLKSSKYTSTPSASPASPVAAASVRFERYDFLIAMQELHSFYSSSEGLNRPNGLSIGGAPDFEGIAAWIFDVYLTARAAGAGHGDAFANVRAHITQSEEWQINHPGQQPTAPRAYNSPVSLNRAEFLQAMSRLHTYYSSEEGLQRPNGLSIGGAPDFEGIAAWIFDIYLNARLMGSSPDSAWNSVVSAIRQSDEWKSKHPIVVGPTGPSVRVARTGVVRKWALSIADDQGEFFGLGASLFWAAWGYKHDREKLERNLQYLAENGFDYIRVLGNVGCGGPGLQNCPGANQPQDWWEGREVDPREPGYDDMIRDLTDLAYDKYGLRIEWTLMGDAQLNLPTMASRFNLVDRFLQMSQGREQKIMHFEIANEAWQNGFSYDFPNNKTGIYQLRELGKYMADRTPILVALSTPGADATMCPVMNELYAGDGVDMATAHYDRAENAIESVWRPVRMSWEKCGQPFISNNEPIGPGSSVNTEEDPVRLVMNAVVGYISQNQFYVYHTEAGVWGGTHSELGGGRTDVYQYSQGSIFQAMKKYMPADISNWTRQNSYNNSAYPITIYAGGHAQAIWPEGYNDGVVRAYGATKGNEFVIAPIGIKNFVSMQANSAMELDVIHPVTGEIVQHLNLAAKQYFELRGLEAYVLKGRTL